MTNLHGWSQEWWNEDRDTRFDASEVIRLNDSTDPKDKVELIKLIDESRTDFVADEVDDSFWRDVVNSISASTLVELKLNEVPYVPKVEQERVIVAPIPRWLLAFEKKFDFWSYCGPQELK
jgi:hypothetical protein